LASLVDLSPTFAEAAGAKVEARCDGQSLLALIDGREDGAAREVIGDYCGEATIEPTDGPPRRL
jgi:arylsulfatase A-like enzyme